MQIKYYFATEEVTVDVEVSPEIEAYLEESNRLEENYERNCRRRNYSLEAYNYEGLAFTSFITPETLLLDKERHLHIIEALRQLTDIQRERLFLLADGINANQIAKEEGLHHSSVNESIETARKKFQKFYLNTPQNCPSNVRIMKGGDKYEN